MVELSDFHQLREVGGTFVRDYAPWTVWGTATYLQSKVSEESVRSDVKKLVRGLAKTHCTHIPVALGMEEQSRGVLHVHLLLMLLAVATEEDANRLRYRWRRGRSDFQLYRPAEAAAFYLAGHRDWDILVACPRRPVCRRSSGCKEGHGLW